MYVSCYLTNKSVFSTSSTGADGDFAINALLASPSGIAYDQQNDRLFFAESTFHRIRYIKGGRVYHFAGSRVGQSGALEGYADNSTTFFNPRGLDYSNITNHLYVADASNQQIRAIDSSKIVSIVPTGLFLRHCTNK